MQIGDTISVSYYDKDGKTKIKNIHLDKSKLFNWKTCSEANSSADKNYTNWNGESVKKMFLPYSEQYFDKKENRTRTRTISRLTNFRIAEILDDLPKDLHDEIFGYALPKPFFVDIETKIDSDLSIKESAEQTRQPITVIGIATPDRQIIVLSSEKNLTPREVKEVEYDIQQHTKKYGKTFTFRFKCFGSETQMMEYYLKNMVSRMPMMSGWNFVEFDWKYIVNRCSTIGVDIKQASPIKKMVGKEQFPAHVAVVDYMECYQKWDTSVAKENLKLDQAGYDVLGIQKVHYNGTLDDLYRDDFKKYVYYNAIDCALVEMLHEKLGVSSIGNTLTYIAKCPTMRMFSPVALTESILARDYYAQNKVLAVQEGKNVQQAYDGAYVKKPIIGFHKCCICNDFASLYPNAIRELNLSPETLLTKLEEYDIAGKQQKLKEGFIVSESGCVFKKDPGVFSTLVGRVYNQRKRYKKTAVNATIKARLLEDLLKENITDEKELKARYEQIMNS